MFKILRFTLLLMLFGGFSVQQALAQSPTVASFSPSSGPVGTLVTITGTNLDNLTSFTIGGTQAIAVSNTGTTLVGMVMPGATTGNISVTTGGGTATANGNFTVTATLYPGSQQGVKLTGTGSLGTAQQGYAVAISADGNTAIMGGVHDNSYTGAAWVYTRSGGVWSQQGSKLIGTGAVGAAFQGVSVGISADGNTAIIGGRTDNSNTGAVWIFTRNGNTWNQQGSKLVGSGASGAAYQGWSVSLSADGNTALVGGNNDNNTTGAMWVFARSSGVWAQQGTKLVGSGSVGAGQQGFSVSLSADGNTAASSAPNDNSGTGAVWVYARSGSVWSQQGGKLVGSGAVSSAQQGISVAVSADGNTAMWGAQSDNGGAGAAWVYTRSGSVWSQQGPKLVGTGAAGAAAQGTSVSLSADGNVAMISGSGDNSNTGSAWLFTRSSGVWAQQGSKLVGTGMTGPAQYGRSVSISADGSTAWVGGYADNSDAGAVWAYTVTQPPTITSFSPASGPVGTLVTITGTNLNLDNLTSFSIGGAQAVTVSNTGTVLVGMVMPGATTGGLTVSTNGGTATASGSFTVTATPYPSSQQGSKLVGTGGSTAQQGIYVAVSADGNTAVVGGYTDNSNQGAAWVYTRSGGVWSQVQKLFGTGAISNALQGSSVGISADGSTIVVGGKGDNSGIGAFWAWTRTGSSTWTQQSKQVPIDPIGAAGFGYSISLSADGNTAVVGGTDDNAGAGAAWVFTRSGGNWAQQAKSVGQGSAGNAKQGICVSLSADGNTFIVSGPTDNSNAGAAWVFTRSGSAWNQQGNKLVGTGAIGSAQQGSFASISADGNTAIVGGQLDNGSVGAAWVYTRSGGTWAQQAKLVGTGNSGSSLQGISVSLSADGNTAMVGGNYDNGNIGATWVWTRSGVNWTQRIKLVGTGNIGQSYQGRCVSVSADGSTAFAGGYQDNSNAGAVWVYIAPPPPTITSFSPASGQVGTLVTISGSNLDNLTSFSIGGVQAVTVSNTGTVLVGMVMPGATTGGISVTTGGGTVSASGSFTVTPTPFPGSQQGAKLIGTGATASSYQGRSVAVSADGNTAVIGGYYDNNGAGAAWVYTRSGGAWSQQGLKLVGTGATGSAQQGSSVAISADGNTIIVGGSGDNSSAGAVWIFTRSGSTWSQQGTKLVGTGASGTSIYQGFSVSISADGNTAILGGYGDNTSRGAAWVFVRNSGTWSQQGLKLVGTGGGIGSLQGYSVSLSADGNTFIAGGSNDNANNGAAWVFTRSGGVWAQQGSKLVGTGAIGAARQGSSVAISADGSTAMVGGSNDNNSIGAAWVYTRSGSTWSQQGLKLVGSGNVSQANQGYAVSLSADGNSAIVGGYIDNNNAGAAWVYTRSGSTWVQQGAKLVGTGATGAALQGYSVSLSADGSTAMVGGWADNNNIGAAWAYTVTPPPVIASFSPVSSAAGGTVTLTGSNFTNATAVSFGGTPATSFTVVSATSITAVVGAGATGAVSVTTPSGTGTLSGFSFLSSNSNLSAIALSSGTLSPVFASGTTAYSASVANGVSSITLTPTTSDAGATVTVNGTAVTSGSASTAIALNVGTNAITTLVTAQDGTTQQTYTTTVTRAQAAQSITFAAFPVKTYGDAGFATGASASSGLALTYASSNTAVATVSNSGVVTILSAGTADITASQPGNATYLAATPVTQTLTVNKAVLTVTADNQTKTYNSTNPTLTVTYSGFTGSDNSSSVTTAPTVSTTATTSSAPGSYPITPSGATADNYNFSYVNGTLTVGQAAQTITFAAPAAKTYGDNDFMLNATASSNLSVSYTSSNTSVATVDVNGVVHIASGGSTVITASQVGNANYAAATSVNRTLTVNSNAQTITLASSATKIYGDADYNAGATTSSGLTISYASSNTAVATVNSGSGLVHIVAPGTATITASQAGNANYAATSANQTLTVNQSSQTITFASSATKTYGDADYSAGATASSGLAVTYTSSNTAVATVNSSTGLVRVVAPGTATITASQAGNANYTAATPVTQTLTVNKASLTIAADNQSKDYGAAIPTLTVSYTGFVNSDNSSSLGTQPTIGTTATSASAVGNYPITASGAASANYTFTYTAGTLTVGQAAQTIAFAALPAKTYGDASFTLGATASSGLNVTYVSSDPTVASVSGSTVTIVKAGTATITASQTGSSNYTPTADVAQILTINKASLMLTADNQSRSYGAANPTLTVSYSGFVNSDNSASLTTAPTISTVATTLSAPGSYPITVNGAASSNYTFAYTAGTLTVGQASQTITFATPAVKTYGDANFALGATASSGLAVSYTSSNTAVATVDANGNVHILSAGSTILTASQAGNSSYAAATSVNQTLTVNNAPQAVQTITFAALPAKTYGDADFALGATASSGLAISYTSSNTLVATVNSSGLVHILSAGTATITASQAGNSSYLAATTSQSLTVNPSVAPIAANPANGSITNVNTPVISGTAPAGSSVKIYVDGTLLATVIADATGNYTYTLTSPISSGSHNTNTTVTDGAGNLIWTSPVSTFTIDTTPPEVAVTASPANGSTVSTGQPTISGTAEPRSTVKVYVDGTLTATVTADGSGHYTYTPSVALNAGSHTVTTTVTDAAGNVSATSAASTFTVNTGIPPIAANPANGSSTNSTIPVISGTAPANSTVKIYLDGTLLATVTADATGHYTYTPTMPLTDGSHTITTTVTDGAGNVIATTPASTFTIDTTPPAVAANTSPANGGTVTTGQPTISGTAEPGSKVGIYIDGKLVATVTADVSGNYTYTPTPALSAGSHTVTTTVTDAAGNVSAAGPASTFTVNPNFNAINSLSLALTTVFENTPSGSLAGTLTASPTANASYTYSLVTGAGSADNTKFSIRNNQVVTNQPLDYEQQQNYSIRVRAGNASGQYLEQIFALVITDVNEAPTLAAVANQQICSTNALQTVQLSGISAGPESTQTTVVSVRSSNPALFSLLYTSAVSGGKATLNYQLTGAGTATVTVTVKDNGGVANGGVDSVSQTFTLTSNALPLAVILSDKGLQISKGDVITLTASGGGTYNWGITPNISGTQSSATIRVRPSQTTTYPVTVTNATGCTSTVSITVQVKDDYALIHPANLLTPNGDGKNDTWVVKNLDLYPNNTVTIYDQSGRLINKFIHYNSDWDGTLNGSVLSEGTYYYVIDFGDGKGVLKGFITILRNR